MSITQSAIRNNRTTLVALAVVVLAGLGAYRSLPRAMDPGFIIRTAQITTVFPGASPQRVEMLVTDKIEKAVQEIPQLDFVSSQSKAGVSVVFVNIKEKYKELRPIWDDLRRKMEQVELPDSVLPPDVNDEFGDTFGIILGLTGDGYSYAELKDVADDIRDEILRFPEAAKVQILGAQEERVFIEYNNARLAQLGISTGALQGMLASSNIIIPGGEVYAQGEIITLEPSGNFESLADIEDTVLRLPGSSQITLLKDIATVRRGYVDPPKNIMRVTGEAALGLAVSLRDGGNITTLGADVRALLDRLEGLYPHGVDFHEINFLPENVDMKVDDFVMNVVQSVVIVLVVMLIFLGLRTGLLVASLIPTTMVVTLLLMSGLDIGLDQMSLASLIIALGMLVDNAIVLTESILVQMESGKARLQAAVDSAKELRVPLLTASLTTAAAFLPIFLAKSSVGEYTAPLFKVVSLALLTSWILALTMTPLLCVLFLRVKMAKGGKNATADASAQPSRWQRGYERLLMMMLRHRLATIGLVLLVFFAVMSQFGRVPQAFFPADESKQFTAKLSLPVGTTIERTSAMAADLEDFMRQELMAKGGPADAGEGAAEGIVNWATFVGGGAPKYALSYTPDPPSPEAALLIINATSSPVITELIAKMEAYLWDRYPDLDAKIRRPLLGPPVENPIEVRILGKETGRLFALADAVKAKLRTLPGTKNIVDNWGQRTKKLEVEIDSARAYRAGVSNQDIALSLMTNLSGFETSSYREDDKTIPIILRSVKAERSDLGKLETLNIFAQGRGTSVPLKQVADIKVQWEPSKVLRRDRLRSVIVQAQLQPGTTAAQINAALIPWLEEQSQSWELGYRFQIGGEFESSGKANDSINEQMPIAGLIILLLLVSQFNSLRRTGIILATIPLALIGVVTGLLITGSYFGFMTLLGIISLAGIVINNAIVLLERIKIEIEDNGLSPQAAVVEAARRRMRPILLTTATTVGGLLPLWFGGGAMWEPMAISIIFGLLFSTALTLGVVPVLYALFFRVSYKS